MSGGVLMGFPQSINCLREDTINDKIWGYLHNTDRNPLDVLNPKKFSISNIIDELNTGCSPCPDILTSDFGGKPSVIFISTVYGLIYKYLLRTFNRESDNWQNFIKLFYNDIIKDSTGIYGKLGKIYDQVAHKWRIEPDFCFTELVKTVLVDDKNSVSGLDTKESFVQYFLKYESKFLSARLENIQDKCIAFTFSDVATLLTITTLSDVKITQILKLPDNIELFYSDYPKDLFKFATRQKRTGNIEINISAGSSYSNSIAFNTIFKVHGKEFYIIPLPHPSGANNQYWTENVWKKIDNLLKVIPM